MQANTIISNMNKTTAPSGKHTHDCSQLHADGVVFIWLRRTISRRTKHSSKRHRRKCIENTSAGTGLNAGTEYINRFYPESKFKIHLDTNSSFLPHPKELFKQKIELTSTPEVLPAIPSLKFCRQQRNKTWKTHWHFFIHQIPQKIFLLQEWRWLWKKVASNENKEKCFEHTV